jgi:hypothetical protein
LQYGAISIPVCLHPEPMCRASRLDGYPDCYSINKMSLMTAQCR